jgi:hypothetical protein
MPTNEIFMATNINQMQRIVFWMQQAQELLQQILSFRQRYFIVATGMHNRNQRNIHGNKHKSNATNCFLDATCT